MKTKALTLPYLILVFCCSSFNVAGQSSFIETLSESTFLQGNAKRWIYDSLKNDPQYAHVTPIRVNDLWSFQTGGMLTFSLPHVQFTLNIRATAPRRYTNTRYTWSGTIVNQYNQPIGRAVFFQEGDKYFGTIELPDRKLVIRDLNAGIPDDQVLVEFDQTNPPGGVCGTNSALPPPGGPPPPPPPPDTCEAIVTVLFLHTQRVLDEGLDPEQIAISGVEALNTALDASSTASTNVRVVIAGNELLTSFDDDANEARDSRTTINDVLPQDSITQALRDEKRADIIVLLQNADIFYAPDGVTANYGVVGLANVNDMADSTRVYSTVEANFAGVTETIVHEIGHLFGCRHREGGHAFANGYQICLATNQFGDCEPGAEVNTIMNPSAADNTVYRFSNADPNVLYQGVPTGAADADNMRMINQTACRISEFRMPIFYPIISGPTNVSHNVGADYDYSSLYLNCIDPQGPSAYTWDVSWDYGNTYSHLSYEEDAVLEGEDVPTHAPWGIIRLTAVCAGETSVAFLDIKNWTAQNLNEGEEQDDGRSVRLNEKSTRESPGSILQIYPNPAHREVNVVWRGVLERGTTISLINIQGQRNIVFKAGRSANASQVSFDVSQYPAGYYTLEFSCAETCIRKPLIISRQ